MSDARTNKSGISPAAVVESFVRSVQSEPADSPTPWGWIAAALILLAVAARVAFDRLVRRRS